MDAAWSEILTASRNKPDSTKFDRASINVLIQQQLTAYSWRLILTFRLQSGSAPQEADLSVSGCNQLKLKVALAVPKRTSCRLAFYILQAQIHCMQLILCYLRVFAWPCAGIVANGQSEKLFESFKGNSTVAQAVSRRFPTAAARFRTRVKSCGICGGHSGTGTGFLRVLRLPLPSIAPIASHLSSFITPGWYTRPFSGLSNSGLGSTPPHEKKEQNLNENNW
jgi:hypothetical protein